jgi:tetratricopeptide (TPR) repeat protein
MVTSHLTGVVLAIGLIASVALAVPVMRPWEYFNEIAGGTENGHKYFDGEGVDLYQRVNEIRRYYHEVLKPQGELPYVFYLSPDIDEPSKTFDRVRRSGERDRGKWDGPFATGTFITGANEISPSWAWDKKSFRDAQPLARFGNLLVFQGTFDIRPMRAQALSYIALFQIYGPEPNIEQAIAMLSESFALDPRAFFVALELGNQYLKLGRRDEALNAYQGALDNCPDEDPNKVLIADQVARLKNSESLDGIQPLRNPAME